SIERDRFEEALQEVNDGLVIARERGDRLWERHFHSQLVIPLAVLGRWDEAVRVGTPLLAGEADLDALGAGAFLASISAARGDESIAARCVELASQHRDSTYVDLRAGATCILARDALERGAPDETLSLVVPKLRSQSGSSEIREETFALGIEAAFALDSSQALSDLESDAAALPSVLTTPLILAGRSRLGARLADLRGDRLAAEQMQDEAIGLLRSVQARPLLAKALLERARRSGDADALA